MSIAFVVIVGFKITLKFHYAASYTTCFVLSNSALKMGFLITLQETKSMFL